MPTCGKELPYAARRGKGKRDRFGKTKAQNLVERLDTYGNFDTAPHVRKKKYRGLIIESEEPFAV
jgi:hypothetical protein